jgi:DNA modification methylase
VPRSLRPHTTLTSGSTTFRFHLGDCTELLPQLGAGSVDAIVTSPPYNLGIRYRTYDDTIPRSEYLQWTDRWLGAAAGALSPQGSLFLNVGAKPTDPEHASLDQVDCDRESAGGHTVGPCRRFGGRAL